MTDNELLNRLKGLHEELSGINVDLDSADRIDDETVVALSQLMTDTSGLVERANSLSTDEATGEEHKDLADRIFKFESNHPRVARFLNQVTDFLAMIGI